MWPQGSSETIFFASVHCGCGASGAAGVLFYNTLFDENAACHIAVGQSYNKCFVDGKTAAKEDLVARGANQSNAHVDWMIGSNRINVDGICQNGDIEPVMRGCEWVNA